MTAHQATRATLEKVLGALLDKLPLRYNVSDVTYRDREAGLARMQFFLWAPSSVGPEVAIAECRRVVNRRHALACRFDDPLEVVKSEPIDAAPDLNEADALELFGEDASVQGDHLPALARLVDRYVALEGEVEALEAQLDRCSKEMLELRTQRLPELMRAARITKQDMESGHRVTLGVAVFGKYPEGVDERKRCDKALEALGSLSLLKHQIGVALPPEREAVAAQVIAYLKRKKLDVRDDTGIHAGTYRAWAKEMLANERLSPLLLEHLADLNLTIMDQVTVKLPKRR